MIKTIKIKNFQSHLNTELEFVEGLNVFVGRTNSGKSALFRAFLKVLRNQPSGTSLVTLGNKECKITLNDVEKYMCVSENKSGDITLTENRLKIGDANFDKLGRGLPPEELFNHLQMSKPIEIAGVTEDFNFTFQRAPSFLISKTYTPSVVAKFFDFLSGVGVLNACLQEVKTRQRENTQKIKRLEDTEIQKTQELESYVYVETLQHVYGKAKKLDIDENKLEKFKLSSKKLKEVNIDIKHQRSIFTSLKPIKENFQKIRNIIHTKVLITQKLNIDAKLKEIFIPSATHLKKKYKILTLLVKYINVSQQLKDLVFPNISKLQQKFKRLQLLSLYYNNSLQLFREGKEIQEIEINISSQLLERQNILKEMRICPTCGQEITQ